MAIGKYLQLYRNADLATSLEGAITKLSAANVNEGSPVVVRYTEDGAEHALFGVKGKGGLIQYVELATGNSAITNKRLKDLANSLVNSITGETANGNNAYVSVESKKNEDGPLTYEVKLVNVASNASVKAVDDKVNTIDVSDRKNNNASYSYTITLPSGDTKDIVIDKDNSLTDIQLGNKDGDEFTQSTEGQVIRFTYLLADGSEKIVDIDLGKAVFDFELGSIVNEALEYTTDGKINVKYDNSTIKLNDNKLYVDTTVIDNAIASADSATRTAITSEIDTAIKGLDVDEVKGEGKVVTAVSQTDGKISATLGQVEAKHVKFEKDTESQLKSTNVNAAILELEDTISSMAAEALGIKAGQGISIAAETENSSTQVISTKVAGDLDYDENGAIKITVASGSENGTIAVNGANINVTGLKSAAYTESSDYDAAGTAKDLVDGLNATVKAYESNDTTKLIENVQIVQENGKITSVTVTEGTTWDCGTF